MDKIQMTAKDHWGPNGMDPTPAPQPPGTTNHFRNSFVAVLVVYGCLGVMAAVNAVVGHQLDVPSGLLPWIVMLSPVLALGVKDYLYWVTTGQWSVPGMARTKRG